MGRDNDWGPWLSGNPHGTGVTLTPRAARMMNRVQPVERPRLVLRKEFGSSYGSNCDQPVWSSSERTALTFRRDAPSNG